MKKAKLKKWMILLSILTISIVPLSKAKAITNKSVSLGGTIISTSTGGTKNLTQIQKDELNFNGWAIFNVYSVPYCSNGNCSPTSQIKDIYINSTYETSICELGNQMSYNDSTKQVIGYSVKCPIQAQGTYNSIGVNTLDAPMAIAFSSYMGIEGDDASGGNSGVSQSSFDTFKNDLGLQLAYIVNTLNNTLNSQDYNQVLNNINTNQTTTNNKVQALIDQDLNEWNEWKNTDISASAKQQPSQQNYDSVHTFENGIFSDLDDPNILALIDLGIDTDTNTWIWNTMTGIFNANVRVMTMVISVLTLGLAKFLMGR